MQQNLNVTNVERNLHHVKYNINIIIMYSHKSHCDILLSLKNESIDSGSPLKLVQRDAGVNVKSKTRRYAF